MFRAARNVHAGLQDRVGISARYVAGEKDGVRGSSIREFHEDVMQGTELSSPCVRRCACEFSFRTRVVSLKGRSCGEFLQRQLSLKIFEESGDMGLHHCSLEPYEHFIYLAAIGRSLPRWCSP